MPLTGVLYDWFEDIFSNKGFSSMEDVLTLSPSAGFSSAWTVVETVYNHVMVPIALSMMIIWFCTKFMEKATAEQVTFQQLFLLFVKLLISKILIDNGLNIFGMMWSLGISLVKEVGDVFRVAGWSNDLVKQMWYDYADIGAGDKLGLWRCISTAFELLVPWLVSYVITGICYYIAYTRLLEMFVRVCGAPLALSDFMSEGLNGAGWKYLKNFLAVCLQGMIIIIIARLHGAVLASAMGTGPDGFMAVVICLAVSFATVGLMMKSLTLSKELLGTA